MAEKALSFDPEEFGELAREYRETFGESFPVAETYGLSDATMALMRECLAKGKPYDGVDPRDVYDTGLGF